MTELENREKAIELFDCYGVLLTPTQQEFFKLHFLLDLSLKEIAEEKKVSRAAINDALIKSLKKMNEYENKLGLVGKKKKISDYLAQIDSAKEADKKALFAELEEYLRYGI